MRRFLFLSLCFLSGLSTAQAETIRGGIDCQIEAQSYLTIDSAGLVQSDGRPQGDPTGSTLRLRYEITRANTALPYRFKVEFSRFDIYFDATYRPSAIEATQQGWQARNQTGDIAASFAADSITLASQGRQLYLEAHEGENWIGYYTATQQSQSRHILHHMGLSCTHLTNAIEQISAALTN